MTNPKHTDTSRSDDLMERLRSPGMVFYEYGADKGALLHSCADCIEALEAENERLRETLAKIAALTRVRETRSHQSEWTQDVARAAPGEKQ